MALGGNTSRKLDLDPGPVHWPILVLWEQRIHLENRSQGIMGFDGQLPKMGL